jgi:CelD/BcsL family acetyltransferase involved in cellulose biosynthesis
MKIETYSDPEGFAALAAEWNPLLAQAYAHPLFMTLEWQRTWWEYLGKGDLLVVAMREDDGELVGLAPLYRTGEERIDTLELVGCVEVSDYLDIIAVAGRERQVYEALMDYLDGPGAPAWDAIQLCNLPESSPTPALLGEIARGREHQVMTYCEDVCPIITLLASWDEYLETLDKKQRHEIRRKLRRAESSAVVSWHIVDKADDLEAAVATFIDLHEKSSMEKQQFWDARMRAFFKAIARIFLDRGWLQLSFLTIDGYQIAALLCFDYDNVIFVYNSGYDPARYAYLSPGIVLMSYCLQHAIALGRREFDFLQGDEEYKFRFGAVSTNVYRLCIAR